MDIVDAATEGRGRRSGVFQKEASSLGGFSFSCFVTLVSTCGLDASGRWQL
jgi:hypothetical protein